MPRAYSMDLRDRVIKLVASGSSARAAGRLLGVSESTAIKWVDRWRRTGRVAAKQMGGYKRPVLEQHREKVLGLIAEQPDLTIEEIRAELRGLDIEVGYGSVWRFLARQGISVKKNRAGQRTRAPRRGAGAGRVAKAPARS